MSQIATTSINARPANAAPAKLEAGYFEPGKLSDHSLLAAFLTQMASTDVANGTASAWIQRYGNLRGLICSVEHDAHQLQTDHSTTELAWLMMLRISGEIFTRQLAQNLERGTPLTSPADTLNYLQRCLLGRRREVFHCMFMDTRHRVICHEELFQGSIDGACVYPRVVAEHALRNNAAAVIVAHNHPSGVSEPSLADQAITRRLKEALALLEIRLLDHFVIGDGEPVSMASRGML
jgi:DNA repair protein RadC